MRFPSMTFVALSLATLNQANFALAQSRINVAKTDTGAHRSLNQAIVDRTMAEQHALWPALELAVDSYKHIRRHVRDYSCQVIRRERVGGALQPVEYMAAKVRHARSHLGTEVVPFGVYLKVLAPDGVKGREILYVTNRFDNDMFVRNGGKRFAFVTTRIKPDSDTAMANNRYPVTEFGFENLVRRLIEVVKEEIRYGIDSDVQFYNDAKVDGRSCTGIVVKHPAYDSRLRFYQASVFMDNELRVPVHFESYGWPRQEGDAPALLEQYTYRDIRLNVGFSDEDFSPSNPGYRVQ